MRILLSAYACEPHVGSEPGIGWNVAQILSRQHTVHVLTSAMHRNAIETELSAVPNPNLTFTYVDPWGWVYDWSGSLVWLHLHYFLWQWFAYRSGKRIYDKHGFDVVHHATYGTYLKSSFLVHLPVPFIWGPLGGGESTPDALFSALNPQERIKESFRTWARRVAEHNPFLRLTMARADACWAATEDTAIQLQRFGCESRILSSVLWLKDLPPLSPRSAEQPFRLISIGRLLAWKGFHLGIQAFAQADLPNSEYWVVGNGPELSRLRKLVQDYGIDDRVTFLGELDHAQTLAKLSQADVLVHPSLHDSGGFVCVEAMAHAKPVICLDTGGPPMQVSSQGGYLIPPESPSRVVTLMAEAMQQLSQRPVLRQQMGAVARERVQSNFAPAYWEKFFAAAIC